jgi:2'-5' RNA ligase
MADIRTFIAFELPGVVAQRVTDVIHRLSFLGDKVRWVKADNVHLTLRFLGDISPELVPEIVTIVQNVTHEMAPLTLCVAGLGGFSDLKNARVIWLGVQGDVDRLRHLHELLEARLTPFGLEPDRRKYFPHITLGRARRNAVDVDVARVGPVQPIHFRVDRLTVLKSELRPEGTVYKPLGYGLLKK